MKKFIYIIITTLAVIGLLSACGVSSSRGTRVDTLNTIEATNDLQISQPTPTDIEYSIPRYLLSKRAYWINGQRDKARNLPCPIADMPLGQLVLVSDTGAIVGKFIVEGMIIGLNTYLTPDSEYYEYSSPSYTVSNKWLADIDGTYGMNESGIFWFDSTGLYGQWSGDYLYTDIPIEVNDPVIRMVE